MGQMGMSDWLGHSVQNGSVRWIRCLHLSSTGGCTIGIVCGSTFAKGLLSLLILIMLDINNV